MLGDESNHCRPPQEWNAHTLNIQQVLVSSILKILIFPYYRLQFSSPIGVLYPHLLQANTYIRWALPHRGQTHGNGINLVMSKSIGIDVWSWPPNIRLPWRCDLVSTMRSSWVCPLPHSHVPPTLRAIYSPVRITMTVSSSHSFGSVACAPLPIFFTVRRMTSIPSVLKVVFDSGGDLGTPEPCCGGFDLSSFPFVGWYPFSVMIWIPARPFW